MPRKAKRTTNSSTRKPVRKLASSNSIKHELRKEKLKENYKLANKSVAAAVLLGIFLPPLAYLYLRKWVLFIACLLTGSFFLLGSIIVPIHTYMMIKNAREITGKGS